jgi:hypothetical protein
MTAVEWLLEQLKINNYLSESAYWLINEAKEMEKQQIIEAHGDKLKKSLGTTNFEYWLTGEDYYKKQFNK